MIIESGIIISLGLIFLAIKLPKRTLLWLLGRPLTVDVAVSAAVYALHWGTFTGVMAAAFAGMMTSMLTTVGRRMFGYIDGNRLHRGFFSVPITTKGGQRRVAS